jgi:PAS domain S-box-containing protein
MESLTGCTRDELIGAPFKDYFTDPERAEGAIKLALREKRVTDYELAARDREGMTTDVSYNASTLYDRDRVLQGVFAAARDVTERQINQQALRKTNVELESAKSAAEKANLAKSEFLSNMSHELRSPLNAILGFAQLMESSSPLPTDSQKESIAQILQAGWHLLKLINEILDLTHLNCSRRLTMVTTLDILNAKVLIVDDQQAHVLLLERALRGAGYMNIQSTMDPREVCELHRQNRYAVILLDLKMPGMDGFEVMEGLRELEAEGDLPVLVITAEPGHKLRALRAGARDFVTKPIDLAEMLMRIHNAIEVRLLNLKLKLFTAPLIEESL